MIPPGATHFSTGYEGDPPTYYRHREMPHLNQVSEEWEIIDLWDYWDLGKWVDVGPGFCNRRLKEINHEVL